MIEEGDDAELEFSPLGGRFTEEGITVQVHIYRMANSEDGWTLEVVDHEDGSTVWQEPFDTDQEAYHAFRDVVEREGIAVFLADPDEAAE